MLFRSTADLLESAYSTSTLLTKSLDESRTLPLGQRIQYFRQAAVRIVQKSGNDPLEEAVRMTLKRSVEISDSAIKIAGENPQVIAQWSANFYKTAFELAVAFANNPCVILTKNSPANMGNYLRQTSIAQYGYYFATLLWRNQANLTSDASKAFIMIKMIGYLGKDFNEDVRRRENPYKETIADIYQLQNQDMNYKNILRAFANDESPAASDVSAFRVKEYKAWSSLPAKLTSAGLPTQPTVK